MGLEYVLPRRKSQTDESLASFVQRRFGREALERLVQPLVGGIYTSDPEKLSLQATMPRFIEMEREYRSLIRPRENLARKKSHTRKLSPNMRRSGEIYGLFTTLEDGNFRIVSRPGRQSPSECGVAFGSFHSESPRG